MLIRGISQIIGIPWCRWCCWWCGFPDGWCRVLICMMMGFHKSWWCGFQNRDDLADDVDSPMVDDEPRSAWWWGSGRWDFAALGVRIAWLKGSHLYRPPPLLLNPYKRKHITKSISNPKKTLISPTTPSFESIQAHTQNKINIKATNTYIAHHPLFWICPTYYGHKYNTNSKANKW